MTRVRVYVDGYNLYYNLLRKTDHKWLDVVALAKTKLLSLNSKPGIPLYPAEAIDALTVKYFSARITERGADTETVRRQQKYWQALERHSLSALNIIEGKFAATARHTRIIDPANPKRPYDECERTQGRSTATNRGIRQRKKTLKQASGVVPKLSFVRRVDKLRGTDAVKNRGNSLVTCTRTNQPDVAVGETCQWPNRSTQGRAIQLVRDS